MATTTATPYSDLPHLLHRLTGDEKHAPSAHSTLDVLWVLYDRDPAASRPDRVDDPDRDRFLLSKGHGPAALLRRPRREGLHPARLAGRPGRPGQPARSPPGPDARARASRSAPARSGTGSASASAPRSACGPRACCARGCTSCSATPSWTRAPTTRRSRTRARPVWTRSPRSSSTTARPRTAGRAGSRAGSPSTDGPRPPWTAATTTRSRPALSAHRRGPAARGRRPRRGQGVSTMRETFIDTATALLDDDPRTALVLADISAAAFAPAARRHPDRVLNVGIREQLMLGVAGGLALTGLRPIVHSYAHVRGRPGVRADQARPRPPGRPARCWSASARPTTARRPAAPTCRRATSRCSTRSDGWTVHVPGHRDEVAAAAAGGGRHRRSGLPAAVHAGQQRGATTGRAPADGHPRRRAGRAGRGRGRPDARPGAGGRPPGWTSPWPTPTRRGRSTPPGCARSPGPT